MSYTCATYEIQVVHMFVNLLITLCCNAGQARCVRHALPRLELARAYRVCGGEIHAVSYSY